MNCPSQNINFLSPNGFKFSVERLPKVSYFTQSVALPTLTLGDVGMPTPLLAKVGIPSDQLEFSPLVVPFMVDSDMQNWIEIFNWIRGLGFPEEYPQYTQENSKRGFDLSSELPRNYSDAFLTILNAHNNPVKTIQFIDCFPVALEGITFSSTNTDVQYATSSITFNYSYFKIMD